MAPLLGLIVFLGVYPKPVLERIEPSVAALIDHVEANTDYTEPEVGRRGPRGRRQAPTAERRGARSPAE